MLLGEFVICVRILYFKTRQKYMCGCERATWQYMIGATCIILMFEFLGFDQALFTFYPRRANFCFLEFIQQLYFATLKKVDAFLCCSRTNFVTF